MTAAVQPERIIDPRVALAVLSQVGPDLSMEQAMRILFPDEAKKIYDAGRWPCGLPRE